MDVLGTATIEEAAERPVLDKNFWEYRDEPTEANKVVFAENLALAMIQVAAYPNGYITTVDCPTLAGATKVDIVTIGEDHYGEMPFTYRVNDGEVLEGTLRDVMGCTFDI